MNTTVLVKTLIRSGIYIFTVNLFISFNTNLLIVFFVVEYVMLKMLNVLALSLSIAKNKAFQPSQTQTSL